MIAAPWRKICAALPAVALMGAGIAFAAPAVTTQVNGMAVSSDSSAIVVPETALNLPTGLAAAQPDPLAEARPKEATLGVGSAPGSSAPALVLPVGTLPGSSTSVALDIAGIPIRALEAYRKAATLVEAADSTCHIDWALLAAIGRVESNHARFGGNQLDSAGVAQPGIIGIALDGTNGTALITDTDGGRLDRDKVYDRAVGPMQFIPGTWRVAGVDADGDGVKNPQDIADSATATAVYLCSGPGDLALPGDLHAAIMRYNASESYVALVTSIAATYRLGVSALPASDLAAAGTATSTSVFAVVAMQPTISVSVTSALATGSVQTGGPPALDAVGPDAIPTKSAPAVPNPDATVPAPNPTVPDPTSTVPLPVLTTTVPPLPGPTTTVPPLPDPSTTVTALPDPCVTTTDPTVPAPTPTNPCPTATTTTAP